MDNFDLSLIVHRNQLGGLFKTMGYGVGAEIGVFKGKFSRTIFNGWGTDKQLFLIDPWKHYDTGYECVDNKPQSQCDLMHASVVDTFKAYPGVKVLRKESLQAVKDFEDGSLDWVFIDANHAYDSVKADMNAWWPKVRPGGLFSGHDYLNSLSKRADIGVKRAVDEFFQVLGLGSPSITSESSPSWMVFKP